MAHHNTVRRYPPVDYYDVVAVDRWLERMALNLHDGPYAACLLYDGSGELGRFSARSARWSLGGLEHVFDFSRPFLYNGAARRRTVWTG